MFRGAPNYCMETMECSAEVLNIPRRVSNVPRSSRTIHRGCHMFNGAAKYSTESVKCSMGALNIA